MSAIPSCLLSLQAWSATLATSYHERSRVFGMGTAIGIAAAVATLLIPVLGPGLTGMSSSQAVQVMGWAIILLTPLGVGVAVWGDAGTGEQDGDAPVRGARLLGDRVQARGHPAVPGPGRADAGGRAG